jgi:hypothetical protein
MQSGNEAKRPPRGPHDIADTAPGGQPACGGAATRAARPSPLRPGPASVYFQTTEFTCGPATLMMAMAALDPDYAPNRLDELKIWREANMVFMGEGHAGCSQYGLACAALSRGYAVEIYEHNARHLFLSSARTASEAEAQNLLEDYDRQKAIKRGARVFTQRVTPELIRDLLSQDRQLITLTSEDIHGHWCNVHDVDDRRIYVVDPYNWSPQDRKQFEPSAQEYVYHAPFDEWVGFGESQGTILISIGPKTGAPFKIMK